MFDLDNAVENWCNKVVSHNIWDADKIDELKDHLYCIIEQDVNSGTDEKLAFEKATSDLGYPEAEIKASSGRANIIQRICRVLNKIEGNSSSDSPLVIGHAIIWASVMLAMALVVKDKDANGAVLLILLLGWFASFTILDGTKTSAKKEWACLKRFVERKLS
ncbi:hypothetical protein [Alteromonas stellipolaris]|uniref:hypothetical protein n=1 Tax=Alteromonas stellipolaris TaxID=233316 RepID=UPI002494A9BC|nr:hypothetical protein [Alteromonas stellipolaris]